jgi:hypothetical protein
MFHTRHPDNKYAIADDILSPVKPLPVDLKDSVLESSSFDSIESNEKNGEPHFNSPVKEKEKAKLGETSSKDVISGGESTDDNMTPNPKNQEEEVKECDLSKESRPSILRAPKYGKEEEHVPKRHSAEFKMLLHNNGNNKVSFKEDTDVITVENWKYYNRRNTYDGRSCNCNIF